MMSEGGGMWGVCVGVEGVRVREMHSLGVVV